MHMSEKDKYPSELAERFQIRLPPGLRDRIKATAEANGRSMNTEIVSTLENAYPDPGAVNPFDLGFADRIDGIQEMLNELRGFTEAVQKSANDIVRRYPDRYRDEPTIESGKKVRGKRKPPTADGEGNR
jgi:hypothetical protein